MKHIATWIDDDAWPFFEKVFANYPDVLLWNARTGMAPGSPHGLMLSGGTDIGRDWLRQPMPDPSLVRRPVAERDAWEFYALPRALARRLPVFAICRGMQVLNVALGGTLHLDIPGHSEFRHDNVQPLVYTNGAKLRMPKVNSSHHQALDQIGRGIEIEARHIDDDVIEQVRLRDYPFGLGVQYHPERDELYRPLFDAFVEAVRQQKS
ncbi:MAG TPA: gamma-glutamyl-gamma-aminobutyrate hydrolase family protein [Candidatus Methylacidiphilales bacterium]|nr:gamma-glutamyl-gamma-aminobutyrate hydrolase family protein [Candidatus Methylacidiphilales bacterium]